MTDFQNPQQGGDGEALPEAHHLPEQLALPSIAPPPFAPRWPSIRTNEHIALELFLAGEFLNVERFRQLTDSTRLPATVRRLKNMGWPITAAHVPEPGRRNQHRHAAVYHLPKKYIAQVQGTAQKEAV